MGQLPLIEEETEVNLPLIAVPRAVTTVTRAAAIRATIRAYSTIVAPSSPATRRFRKLDIVRLLRVRGASAGARPPGGPRRASTGADRDFSPDRAASG